MAKKVLVAKPFFRIYCKTGYQMLLDKGYDVVCTDLDRDYFLEELIPLVGDIDACVANCEPWGEEALSAAPKVKILARYGTGMNSVDTEACKRHGVMCTNMPGTNANPVAEHIITLMLAAMRDLINLDKDTKDGKWLVHTGTEMINTTVGIVGFGYIGQLVARKLQGFDCKVLAYDVYPNYEVAEQYNVTFTDFDDLLAKSDFVAILVPLLDSTFEMFNAESLAKCKDGVIIVSDARGEVVNEPAMYDALKSGKVRFFASDVFVHEPATRENTPLLTLPNVIATPHNGSETVENGERCGILAAQQIIDTLEGREPQHRRV